MNLLGLSVEDWVAIVSIISTSIGVLIWGFKKAFHNVYEKESLQQQTILSQLTGMVDDFRHTQDNLNETMKELQNDLKQANAMMHNHEVRITVLEKKDEK